jgi:hypothetical protein
MCISSRPSPVSTGDSLVFGFRELLWHQHTSFASVVYAYLSHLHTRCAPVWQSSPATPMQPPTHRSGTRSVKIAREFFLALFVLTFVSAQTKNNRLLLVIFAISTIVSHYALGALYTFILLFVWLIVSLSETHLLQAAIKRVLEKLPSGVLQKHLSNSHYESSGTAPLSLVRCAFCHLYSSLVYLHGTRLTAPECGSYRSIDHTRGAVKSVRSAVDSGAATVIGSLEELSPSNRSEYSLNSRISHFSWRSSADFAVYLHEVHKRVSESNLGEPSPIGSSSNRSAICKPALSPKVVPYHPYDYSSLLHHRGVSITKGGKPLLKAGRSAIY